MIKYWQDIDGLLSLKLCMSEAPTELFESLTPSPVASFVDALFKRREAANAVDQDYASIVAPMVDMVLEQTLNDKSPTAPAEALDVVFATLVKDEMELRRASISDDVWGLIMGDMRAAQISAYRSLSIKINEQRLKKQDAPKSPDPRERSGLMLGDDRSYPW